MFALYFAAVLAIGAIASRVTQDHEDFVLGGRRLGSLIVALGAGASDMSGWLLLGLPGALYAAGIGQVWLPLGLTIGAIFNWSYIAKRLRIYTEQAKNSLTIPSFFENRFNDTTGILRLVTSIAIIVFFTFYVSSGFVSGAILFQSTFNMNYHEALAIGAAVIIIYTAMGGFLAVNWVDLFQGSLMWVALLVVPLMTLWAICHQPTATAHVSAELFQALHTSTSTSWITIISLLAWGFGYFGQPHILVRFMAIKQPKYMKRAAWICMIWMIMSLIGAIFTGLLGSIYYASAPLQNPESVFLQLAQRLFNPVVAGFLLAAVLSAIMSTIAAQLLASSSSLAEDIYLKYLRKQASRKELLLFNRIAVVIIAGVALIFSIDPNSSVLNLVGYAWAGLGASFGPLIICSLFWKRTTRWGGIAGIIVGGLTVIIWKNLANLGGIFTLYEMVPAFLAGLITIIIVSLLTPKPSATVQESFELYKKQVVSNK
jgi:sodium/proline symporter